MADGSVTVVVNANASKAEKELDKVARKIDTIKAKIEKASDLRSPLVEQAAQLSVELDKANAKLYEMQQATPGQYTAKHLEDQKELVKSLSGQYNQVQTQVEKYDRQIQNANYDLERVKEQYGDLALQISRTSGIQERMADAVNKIQKSVSKFGSRLSGLFRNALFFGVISSGLRNVRDWLEKTVTSNENARAAIARLKGALLTLAQPLVSVIIPAFTAFVNILAKVVSLIAKVVSVLFGTSYKGAKAAAKALNDEQNAIDGVGSAAEDAGKSMASFDEINQLSNEKASSGSGGGAGSGDIMPDFSETNLDWLTKTLGNSAGWVTAALLLGGIALVAIGAASGSLPLVLAGLLLIGAGVTIGEETGVLQDWADTLGLNSVEEFVVTALTLGGIAIVAIGAATGNIMMVIAGLLLLGATIAYAEKSGMVDDWAESLGLDKAAQYVTAALLIAGIALVVIGTGLGKVLMIIAGLGLLAAGVTIGDETGTLKSWAKELGLDSVFDYVVVGIQLAGIALIAIGAMRGSLALVIAGGVILGLGIAGQAIGEETLKGWWETLKLTRVQQWVSVALLLVGIGLIAIGAVMGNIAMILGGAGLIGLGIVVAVQNNNLKDWVTTLGLDRVVNWITAGLLLVGLALVIFGILTANIAMVLAGAGLLGAGIGVGIASGTFSKWLDAISGAFKSFAETIKKIFNDLWDGIRFVINGILGLIEGMANGVIRGINFVIDALNSLHFDIPDWVPVLGGKSFGFNIPTLSEVQLPRLASGAVIPPNREFLAVLGDQKSGTNIETPLSTMVQAFKQAMNETGGMGGRQITVVMQLDHRELGRAVYNLNNEETQRVGVKLAGVKT